MTAPAHIRQVLSVQGPVLWVHRALDRPLATLELRSCDLLTTVTLDWILAELPVAAVSLRLVPSGPGQGIWVGARVGVARSADLQVACRTLDAGLEDLVRLVPGCRRGTPPPLPATGVGWRPARPGRPVSLETVLGETVRAALDHLAAQGIPAALSVTADLRSLCGSRLDALRAADLVAAQRLAAVQETWADLPVPPVLAAQDTATRVARLFDATLEIPARVRLHADPLPSPAACSVLAEALAKPGHRPGTWCPGAPGRVRTSARGLTLAFDGLHARCRDPHPGFDGIPF